MKLTPLYPEGKTTALTFSYDDGNIADLHLLDIFKRVGIKGTFTLTAGRWDMDGIIHPDQINAVYAGHEIACHGHTHPFLDRLPRACALNDLMEDRRQMEKLTGRIVDGFALPFGSYTDETLMLLRAAGFAYSRTTLATQRFKLPSDFLEWHPTCHHRDSEKISVDFRKNRYSLVLCYIWGHSYEFDRAGNWGLIEQICSELSGLPEVWYATNREIVRYVTALRQVETSMDAEIVCNPTSQTLWFRLASGEVISIQPGETRRLN